MDESELGNQHDEQDFAAVWEALGETYTYGNPQRGDVREGVILSVRPDEILVDIGAKKDAIVPSRELQRMSPDELQQYHEGDTVDVYVLRSDEHEDNLIVSLRLAREQRDWIKAQNMLDSGEIVECQVTGYNKGGLLCEYGTLQGFVPASQISSLLPQDANAGGDNLAPMVGRTIPVKVIEVNRRRRRLILSERAALREWRAQQREHLLEDIKESEVREGVVSSLRDFGAFVDLGGIDGLIHLSELSWSRVEHPSQVLKVGQKVRVLVLRVDREEQRIGLSLKRVEPDPWSTVADRYQAGTMVKGAVTHLVKFGAFVELEPGIEGLVHVSELSDANVSDPADIVNQGEELWLMVLGVDPDRHRISLSLRQVPDEMRLMRTPPATSEQPQEPENNNGHNEPEDEPESEGNSASEEEPSNLDRPA